jgi:P-type Cu2+ transporter
MHTGMDHKMPSQAMQGMKHEPSGHIMHTGILKRRFFVCLALTIPVLLLSETIQTWFHFTITIPYQAYILLLLAAVIYVYGGFPFYEHQEMYP